MIGGSSLARSASPRTFGSGRRRFRGLMPFDPMGKECTIASPIARWADHRVVISRSGLVQLTSSKRKLAAT